MFELSNWKEITVIQRDIVLGCIPAGYEWLIRYIGIKGGFLNSFQEEFNLQRKGICENNFTNILKAVEYRYPEIKIKTRNFDDGSEKVKFIRSLVEKNIPCLISFANDPNDGWHIMPIIFIDNEKIKFKNGIQILEFKLLEVINRHNNWSGGKDLAWLEEK